MNTQQIEIIQKPFFIHKNKIRHMAPEQITINNLDVHVKKAVEIKVELMYAFIIETSDSDESYEQPGYTQITLPACKVYNTLVELIDSLKTGFKEDKT